MEKALVLDGQWRKSLSVVRSLGRKGVKVYVGEDTRFATSFYSKYCRGKVVYPEIESNPQAFKGFMKKWLSNNRVDVVYPLEDKSIRFFLKHRDEFKEHARIALPSRETMEKAMDKSNTLKIAEKAGVDMPETYFIEDLKEVGEISGKPDYPVVVKPREGFGSRGIKFIQSQDELVGEYRKVHERYPYPLIQEYVEGRGYGCSMLYNFRGQERAYFMHERLREYPVSGGPSTLRKSIMDQELLEASRRLLEEMDWRGLAMVEFKKDVRDGGYKLMEINPRFWGSLALALASKVDFPWLLHRIMMDGDVEKVSGYEEGVECRWILPGDILNFVSNLSRGKIVWDFFRFRDDRLCYDILSREDSMPVVGRLVALGASLFKVRMWNMLLGR